MRHEATTLAPKHWPAAAACAGLIAALVVGVTPSPATAAAAVFANHETITIPIFAPVVNNGPAFQFPSGIVVSGLTGAVADVNVTLYNFAHDYVDQVDVLLVGPQGQSVVLMADVGPGFDEHPGITLTLDDEATFSLPDEEVLSTGTFRPTVGATSTQGCCGWSGTPPGPPAPWGTALSVFDGTAPNGSWSLYVYDDGFGDADQDPHFGAIEGGWSVELRMRPAITSFTPTSGPAETSVTVTGANFDGATAVNFGGAPAAFTVSSPTSIVATVPPAAQTGPIAVTTPNGTATSATSFTVTGGPAPIGEHARDVSLTLTGKRARGIVTVGDGFAECAEGVSVKIQRRQDGRWRSVTNLTSSEEGDFAIRLRDPGKYRALAKSVELASGDVCLKGVSPTVKLRAP